MRPKKGEIAYLSLGTNLGNRLKNLQRAKFLLEKDPFVEVNDISSIYETSPLGPKQKDFLNCVFRVKTTYSPYELLSALKGIEKKMGRVKTVRDGPRVIDLDILFYGKEIIQSKELTIPHPRYFQRKFVLKPLSDIAHNFIPPQSNKSIQKILTQLKAPNQKIRLFRNWGEINVSFCHLGHNRSWIY